MDNRMKITNNNKDTLVNNHACRCELNPSLSSRIIVIHENGTITGGSAKIAIQTAIGLNEKGFKVTYFCATNPIDEKLINTVDEIVCLNQPEIKNASKFHGAIQGIWNKKAYYELNKLLKKYGKHTIVHIHGWSHALSSSIFKACLDNKIIPYVTLHDYFSVCPNGGFYNFKEQHVCHLKPMGFKCCCTNCDARNHIQKIYRLIRQSVQDKYVKNNKNIKYIYISDFSYSKLQNYLNSEDCFYLHNPNDKYPIDKVNAVNNSTYLYIGRISLEKGTDIFCEAISELGIKGIVIGDGPLKNGLAKKFPMIEFTGWKSKQEILPYIKQARCFIFPSKWYEGAPLSTEECLSAGIPCIVSDACAAIDQIEDGINGYIFKSENVEDLKRKIVRVEESTQIFNIGNWKIKNYSLENYIYELLKIYFG